jgi:uncharacterized membrane protein
MAIATDTPAARRGSHSSGARIAVQTTELTGGLLLGIGLGGFIDGILLHQIAQWHNMGSAVLPPTTLQAMSQNMVWDGLFHAVTWLITFVGIVVLWREGQAGTAPKSLRVLSGQMLLGWGVFNFVEGLIDHHLLGIHHVRDLPMHLPLYDWIFLGVGGVLLIVVGWILSRPSDERLRR